MPDYQRAFSEALLDPAKPVPAGLVRPDGNPAGRRFDIYRNNVVTAHTEALGEAFPVVKALVGDEFFEAMAGIYVRARPPSSPCMMFYGEDLPAFLESFAPAAELPYLPDVTRLEHARRLAYHAADHPVADPSVLGKRDAAALMETRLGLQAACRVVRSAHPVYSIWRFNATEDKSPVRSCRRGRAGVAAGRRRAYVPASSGRRGLPAGAPGPRAAWAGGGQGHAARAGFRSRRQSHRGLRRAGHRDNLKLKRRENPS